MDYSLYLNILQQQISNNPTRPKLPQYDTGFNYNKPVPQLITEVLTENYYYTGNHFISAKVFNPNLIKDSLQLCFEFILNNSLDYIKNSTYLITQKYIYIPITFYNQLTTKLPRYLNIEIENDRPITKLQTPNKQLIEDTPITNWGFYYTIDTQNKAYTNPLLPYFRFTGNVAVQNNKSIVYEYEDFKGFYGRPTQRYVSNLPPLNLNHTLGRPLDSEYSLDICSQNKKGYYPSVLNSFQLGEYTGLKTNHDYCKWLSFYQYKRPNNTTFLSLAPPNKYSKDFLEFLDIFEKDGQLVQLSSNIKENNQFFKYNQSTTNNIQTGRLILG